MHLFGDNGIITNAQNANMLSGIAQLEEFLHQKYVENYDSIEQDTEPLQYLLNDRNCGKYFQKSKKGEYSFVDTSSGMQYYFIDKYNLPDELKKNLIGGNTSLSNEYWASFVDIYGVTTDLKVYYCSNGKATRIGAADEEIYADLNKSISGMGEGSAWANTLGINSEVRLRDTIGKTSINITDSSLDFSGMYNFPNLKEINFSNVTRENLEGLDAAVKLEKITFNYCKINSLTGLEEASNLLELKFTDSEIGNYKAISNSTKLAKLYLVRPAGLNQEVKNFCSAEKGIKNAEFGGLRYFGIVGRDDYLNLSSTDNDSVGAYRCVDDRYNVTNVSDLSGLNKVTKEAIRYMNLQNLAISSISCLKDYTNLIVLRCEFNCIETFDGIQKMKNLAYLIARDQYIIEDEERVYVLGKQESTSIGLGNDVLSYIYFDEETGKNSKLFYLDVRNANIEWTSYLVNCNRLTYLLMTGNFSLEDADALGELYNRLGLHGTIEPQFEKEMLNSSKESADLKGENVSFSKLNALFPKDENGNYLKNEYLKSIRLSDCTFTDEDGNSLTGTSLNTKLNTFLSNFKNLKLAVLDGISDLTTIEFVKSCTNLQGLSIDGTGVLTHDGDKSFNGLELVNDCSNLTMLALDNPNIDLKQINSTVVRLVQSPGLFRDFRDLDKHGLEITNQNLLNKLNDCTGFTGRIEILLRYNITWNLSTSTITSIWLRWASVGKVILPSTVTEIAVEGNSGVEIDISRLGNFVYYGYSNSLNNLKNKILNTYNGNSVITEFSIRAGDIGENLTVFENKFNGHALKVNKFRVANDNKNTKLTSINGLQHLVGLKEIHLGSNLVSLADISYLKYVKDLEILEITGGSIVYFPDLSPVYRKIEGEDVLISGCPNLYKIIIENNSIQDDIYNIAKVSSLTELSLKNNELIDVYCLKYLENLHILNLANNNLEEWCYNSENERYNVCELLANLNYKRTGKTIETGLTILHLVGNNINDPTDNDDEFLHLKASDLDWVEKSGW